MAATEANTFMWAKIESDILVREDICQKIFGQSYENLMDKVTQARIDVRSATRFQNDRMKKNIVAAWGSLEIDTRTFAEEELGISDPNAYPTHPAPLPAGHRAYRSGSLSIFIPHHLLEKIPSANRNDFFVLGIAAGHHAPDFFTDDEWKTFIGYVQSHRDHRFAIVQRSAVWNVAGVMYDHYENRQSGSISSVSRSKFYPLVLEMCGVSVECDCITDNDGDTEMHEGRRFTPEYMPEHMHWDPGDADERKLSEDKHKKEYTRILAEWSKNFSERAEAFFVETMTDVGLTTDRELGRALTAFKLGPLSGCIDVVVTGGFTPNLPVLLFEMKMELMGKEVDWYLNQLTLYLLAFTLREEPSELAFKPLAVLTNLKHGSNAWIEYVRNDGVVVMKELPIEDVFDILGALMCELFGRRVVLTNSELSPVLEKIRNRINLREVRPNIRREIINAAMSRKIADMKSIPEVAEAVEKASSKHHLRNDLEVDCVWGMR